MQGVIAAIVTAVIVLIAPDAVQVPLLAGLLWLTVGIYVGMALMDGRKATRIEFLGGLPVLLLAAAATWWPWLLVLAWLAHPLWDLAHHGPVKTSIHPVVVPFCLTYDVLLAGLAAWVAFA